MSEPLLEAELFGIEAQRRAGAIEHAEGGTAFLNDVSELSPTLQLKLLRVLEDSAVRRIGSGTPRPTDVRFIAATNKDLEAEVEAGRFRRDLYFRLSGATFTIPLRRARKDERLAARRAKCSASRPKRRARSSGASSQFPRRGRAPVAPASRLARQHPRAPQRVRARGAARDRLGDRATTSHARGAGSRPWSLRAR